MKMSEKSRENRSAPSTSSVADFRVRTSALPETASGWPANAADSGANIIGSFASYDRASSSWKTYQLCFFEGLETFSETWPRAGTIVNGIAFPQPPLVPLTSVTGYGLLPTLGKNEPKGAGRQRYRGSPEFRGAKMSEGLRSGPDDPIYLHPDFAEEVMGFPPGWTVLEP